MSCFLMLRRRSPVVIKQAVITHDSTEKLKPAHVQDLTVVVTFNPTIPEIKPTFVPSQTEKQKPVEKPRENHSDEQKEEMKPLIKMPTTDQFTAPKSTTASSIAVKQGSFPKKADNKKPKAKRKSVLLSEDDENIKESSNQHSQHIVVPCDKSSDRTSPISSAESAKSTREQLLENRRILYPSLTTLKDGQPSV